MNIAASTLRESGAAADLAGNFPGVTSDLLADGTRLLLAPHLTFRQAMRPPGRGKRTLKKTLLNIQETGICPEYDCYSRLHY